MIPPAAAAGGAPTDHPAAPGALLVVAEPPLEPPG